MPTNENGQSAKIYQFPTKTLRERAVRGKIAPDSGARQTFAPQSVDFGGGWYHDAAIFAERTRKP